MKTEIENTDNDFGLIELDELDIDINQDQDKDKLDDLSKNLEKEKIDDKEIDKEEDQEELEKNNDNKSKEEDLEEDKEILSDEDILEKYGEDVDPNIVKHYNITKDYLITNDDFEFNGKNINEAYEQDEKNRNQLIAQELINRLPENYKTLLSQGLNSSKDLSSDDLNKILDNNKKIILDNFDENDSKSIKSFIKSKLLEKGQDEDDIDDIIDIYEEKNKLLDQANKLKKESDEVIKKNNDEIIKQKEKSQAEIKQNQKKFYDETTTYLNELKYKDNKKKEIQNLIFGKGENGLSPTVNKLQDIFKNPKSLIILADLLSNYKDNNWNLDNLINKKINTKTIKDIKSNIEDKIVGNKFNSYTKTKNPNMEINWEDIEI